MHVLRLTNTSDKPIRCKRIDGAKPSFFHMQPNGVGYLRTLLISKERQLVEGRGATRASDILSFPIIQFPVEALPSMTIDIVPESEANQRSPKP